MKKVIATLVGLTLVAGGTIAVVTAEPAEPTQLEICPPQCGTPPAPSFIYVCDIVTARDAAEGTTCLFIPRVDVAPPAETVVFDPPRITPTPMLATPTVTP